MNYEKKYKEIVGKIRKAYLYAQTDSTKAVLEDIYPELGESEDEKTRKELKYLIEDLKCADHRKKRWIAWIEKQGQVKESTISQHEIETCKENDDSLTYEDERIINIFRKVIYGCNKGEMQMLGDKERDDCLAWLEKQGEENKGNIGGISPNSEWSEEDEENFCSVYLDVKSARQNTVNSLSGELKEQEQKRMDEVISWLKSLKGRVLPKQEWSEEDEQHIDSLLKRLDALCRNKFERTRFAISEDRDWLKSLKERKGGKI